MATGLPFEERSFPGLLAAVGIFLDESELRLSRPAAMTLIGRALLLRCPRCGRAKMFRGMFRMHETCPSCGLRFEREPGYFLGSIYINYGLTALLTTIGWITIRFGYGIESRGVVAGFAVFCVLFPMFFFRYARALWLALDCRFESNAFFEISARAPSNQAETGAANERIPG